MIRLYHRDRLVAEHPRFPGKYQLHILPAHGPGAIARNARKRYGSPIPAVSADMHGEVEVRDLTVYEQLTAALPAA